jgi:hypothetical protein
MADCLQNSPISMSSTDEINHITQQMPDHQLEDSRYGSGDGYSANLTRTYTNRRLSPKICCWRYSNA